MIVARVKCYDPPVLVDRWSALTVRDVFQRHGNGWSTRFADRLLPRYNRMGRG